MSSEAPSITPSPKDVLHWLVLGSFLVSAPCPHHHT